MYSLNQPGQKSWIRILRILSLISVLFLITIFSTRLLSDPDLGFHLKAGRWIIDHGKIPTTDITTFSVPDHTYIDLHWLFQIFIYGIFVLSGYHGLSLVVTFLVLILFFLLWRRNIFFQVSTTITFSLFLVSVIIMEPRFNLRPELFTFIYVSILLLALDIYFHSGKRILYLLPPIMLIWCNMEGLFVLGFFITGSYFISILVRKKKIDTYFILWMVISFFICIINPYFFKGLSFPLELLTRFNDQNIFNQHIKEFRSIFELERYTFRDYLFFLYLFTVVCFSFLTRKKRNLHEILLMIGFLYLALTAIRNIPLFILVSMPVLSRSIQECSSEIKGRVSFSSGPVSRIFIYTFTIVLSIGFTLRLLTDAYYIDNLSYNKTGTGVDTDKQPVAAARFLTTNHLNGRILNSLSFGGWLSWSIPQPIFIDARLEVMKETLYEQIVASWNGQLPALIKRYDTDLIIYDYVKYYPWTEQLLRMPEWRLIYLDQMAAIYAKNDYRNDIRAMDLNDLPSRYHIPVSRDEKEIKNILDLNAPGFFTQWIRGFYQQADYAVDAYQNLGSFCIYYGSLAVSESFLLETLSESDGARQSVFYALADIYQNVNNTRNEYICLTKILEFDPENSMIKTMLLTMSPQKSRPDNRKQLNSDEQEAMSYFNSGNAYYENRDIDRALAEYTKAIRIDPTCYKAYNNRGIILSWEKHLFQEAIRDFSQAIEIRPSYAEAYLGRGTSRFFLKDLSGAYADWKQAMDLGNKQAEGLIRKNFPDSVLW